MMRGKMSLYFHSRPKMSSATSSAGMDVGWGASVGLAVASASAAEVRIKASCILFPSKSRSPPQKATPSTSTARRAPIKTLFFIQKSFMCFHSFLKLTSSV